MMLYLFCFLVGVLIANFFNSMKIKEKAKGDTRLYSNKAFYWVVEEGDMEKLGHITYCMTDLKQAAMNRAEEALEEKNDGRRT